MSERNINSPITIIDLVSDEETKELLLKKIADTKEKIAAAKKKFAELEEKEKIFRGKVIKVEAEIAWVKKRIADVDRKILDVSRASTRASEFEHHTRRFVSNASNPTLKNNFFIRKKSKPDEVPGDESI
ncbi:hypothetical protein CQW23_14293 [Capsicum baccatum]|uniref:Influenza matrix M1 N-terminal domain-containing protein n=1 Tax=Capsicum baccatum TaxID=33114 RepID=A0A2G2WIR4_CAPBA|nr:hypothetical protein CQW23_14293 [Capsicum baccatum]